MLAMKRGLKTITKMCTFKNQNIKPKVNIRKVIKRKQQTENSEK